MKKKRISKFQLIIPLALAVITISCADVENVRQCVKGEPSGFFLGIIHGIVILPAFIISLFSDNVAVYDLNNSGHLYDFGFLIGIGAFSSGAKSSTSKVTKGKRKANVKKSIDVSTTNANPPNE